MTKKTGTKKNGGRFLPRWGIWASIGLIVILSAVIYFVNRAVQNASQKPAPTPTLIIPSDISVDDAFVLLGRDSVVFLDVRPAENWQANQIFQSISIPSTELAGRLSELPKTGIIVIVDLVGGELSLEAFKILQNAGFSSATIMRGGMNEWVQRGYPYIGTVPK